MTPAVSVIMPVRNGRPWVGEAIDSVLRQSLADLECIVVDDGSDDGTGLLLDELARSDDRIRIIHQPALGLVAALNQAITAARAPYLARLDADDRASPERLARQRQYLTEHPDIVLLGSFAEELDANGAVVGRRTPPVDHAGLMRQLEKTNPFIHSSVMMRTAVVRQLGCYRAAFQAAEDYDLWLRLAEVGRIANLSEYLIHYRWHEASSSRRQAVRQSFSVRLAQRAAAIRRSGAADPARDLDHPPDWWVHDSERSFFAEDVGLYRLLDSEDADADVAALWGRLFSLNHVERRLAQLRLRGMLRTAGSAARSVQLVVLIGLVHPGRALGMMVGRKPA